MRMIAEPIDGPAVEFPAFSGPLDLLLHLIRQNEVSIYDIPLFKICDQYHAHLESLHVLDLEVAGDYLWMASWLLHLKSKLLLPQTATDEDDPREVLVERLLAYRRVKELASYLHDQDVVRRCLWTPELTVESRSEDNGLDLEDVDLRLLATTYLEVMQRFAASHPPPLKVTPLRFNVEEKMGEIYRKVISEGLMPLLRHLYSRSDPEEIVAVMVATLELVRLGGIHAEQRRAFAEIYLRPGPRKLDSEGLKIEDQLHG
ncbi:MAG: ScpA family protein [Thermoanaerobaculales bacterium]